MIARARPSGIIIFVAAYAAIRAAVPLLQRFTIVWLVIIAIAGPWIVWDTAKQILTAGRWTGMCSPTFLSAEFIENLSQGCSETTWSHFW